MDGRSEVVMLKWAGPARLGPLRLALVHLGPFKSELD